MGYYKEIEFICLDGDNYSALGIPSEMKHRGVIKENCEMIENKIVQIELVDYYEVSGAIEYGVEVILKCTLSNGKTVSIKENGIKYLSWVKSMKVENGIIEGDFLFLFKGVLCNLSERGSMEHSDFLNKYEEQGKRFEKEKGLVVKEGDIVDIHGRCIYLGEYFYYKPNLKNVGDFVNQLKKYKLYIKIDNEGNYLENNLYVESGKTKSNQPTEVLGHVDFDMDALKDLANKHMENIFEKGIGYVERSGWGNPRPNSDENNKAYVLTNISKTKEDVMKPEPDELLKLGWLCDWDLDKKTLTYKYDSSNRPLIPYEYELKN